MVASLFQICLCFCRVGLYFNDVLLVSLFRQCFFLIFLSVFPLQWEMNFCCILIAFPFLFFRWRREFMWHYMLVMLFDLDSELLSYLIP